MHVYTFSWPNYLVKGGYSNMLYECTGLFVNIPTRKDLFGGEPCNKLYSLVSLLLSKLKSGLNVSCYSVSAG